MDNIFILVTEAYEKLAQRDSEHAVLRFIDVRSKGVFAFRHECREEYKRVFESGFEALSSAEREDMGLGKYYRALDTAYKEDVGMLPRTIAQS